MIGYISGTERYSEWRGREGGEGEARKAKTAGKRGLCHIKIFGFYPVIGGQHYILHAEVLWTLPPLVFRINPQGFEMGVEQSVCRPAPLPSGVTAARPLKRASRRPLKIARILACLHLHLGLGDTLFTPPQIPQGMHTSFFFCYCSRKESFA